MSTDAVHWAALAILITVGVNTIYWDRLLITFRMGSRCGSRSYAFRENEYREQGQETNVRLMSKSPANVEL